MPTALREWVERARVDRTGGKTGLTRAEREELSRLRKQVLVLSARLSKAEVLEQVRG
jgi:hypothetical protein